MALAHLNGELEARRLRSINPLMKYPVVLILSEEGYAIGCPAIPGCGSRDDTREEALANIQDVIREVLEVKQELECRHLAEDELKVETTSVELVLA